uniref:Uncharacterized protein n=1 Tax=Schmidtea mediterranea TaxID=79327 RepID=A0A5P8I4L7_SCHMD|nr:hypothetical protein [Schmidtea mediterranea]
MPNKFFILFLKSSYLGVKNFPKTFISTTIPADPKLKVNTCHPYIFHSYRGGRNCLQISYFQIRRNSINLNRNLAVQKRHNG